MKALYCQAYCEPDDLVYGDLPPPEIGANDVRIAVRAAALNFPDLLMIQGKYQYKSPFPFAPGMECAGEIVEVGPEVTDLSPGDRVAAHPWRGCLAEQVAAPADLVHKLPEEMDDVTAAGFCLTHGTVYHALHDRGALKPGETLLVLGAAGGVGINACTFGKQLGARVIAAASGPEKLELARAHGADEVIDYTREDLRDRVKALTENRGVDVIFDPVGGDATDQAMRCLAFDGRLLIIGFAGGRIADLRSNYVLIKCLQIVGVAFQRFTRLAPQQSKANMQAMFELWQDDKLKPLIGATYPLAEGARALNDMAARRATGKLVVTVDQ